MMMGELSLDGNVQPIKGALPIAIKAKEEGFTSFILPQKNAREAAIVEGIEVLGVENIMEVIEHFNGKKKIEDIKPGSWLLSNANSIDTIDTMIEYYISIEAYERCARLVQIKESILDKETTV